MLTSGSPSASFTSTSLPSSFGSRAARAQPIRSCTSQGSLRKPSSPASSLVMSRRLPTKRFSRSASSQAPVRRSCLLWPSIRRFSSRRLLRAPMIDTSGVRRSWEIELSSARSRDSLACRICACSACSAR
ncbi:MAG: hypothetical protein ACD_75C00115G0001 [uncultured bacterium]|nr:MAG: hypothetical protein ACD_75C00115G0001 [uncultured bacterium]